jgi:hypothetical protein
VNWAKKVTKKKELSSLYEEDEEQEDEDSIKPISAVSG